MRRRIPEPSSEQQGAVSASRGRLLLLVAVVAAGAAMLLAPAVRSQSPGPSTPVTVPFPTTAPGQIGTTVPPQNVFYVSPQGVDCDLSVATPCSPALTIPNLPCAAIAPCLTLQFALAHAHDGDAISLAGGEYDTANPILVTKLVTIAPNGFAAGTTTSSAQAATTFTLTCPVGQGPNGTGTSNCTGASSAAILSGSSITVTAVAPAGGLITIGAANPPLGSSPGCPVSQAAPISPAAAATVVYTCPPGQSISAGTNLLIPLTVSLTNPPPPSLPIGNPTMSASVAGATSSLRPIIKSCATITFDTVTGAPVCNGKGGAVFRITAVGSAALHTTLFGLTIGNASNLAAPGAVILDNDSYTEIAKNVVGAEDLPNAIGILLRSSDHPIIHDNTIQGSTFFPFMISLGIGPTTGGFGVVTAECLGAFNHSNGVQLINNLFAKNSNGGIWFCSDGTGGFLVSNNTIRANGRGIVLLDAVDTYISGNTIGDNLYDGIDLLETSERNYITQNVIESQQLATSSGILLAGNGSLFPKGNQLVQNIIHRNTVDVMIIGAQGTKFVNNSITSVGNNTGVLFLLGNAIFDSGQPIDTGFSTNALQSNGVCSAQVGCAIRLGPGVTVPVDASGQNDFGVTDIPAIQQQIWDHGRDPALGIVYVALGLPTPTPVPGVLGFPTPTAIPAPVPAQTSTPEVRTPVTSPTPSSGATAPSGAPAGSQPVAYLDSSSNTWYVAMSFCITDPQGQAVPNDVTAISFTAQDGTQIGQANVTTDSNGCFSGNVQANPPLAAAPAQVTLTSSNGSTVQSPVRQGP